MRVVWGMLAGIQLGSFPAAGAARVRSQTEAKFTDAIPGDAAPLPYGRLVTGLPCGAAVEFERIGDGVKILWIRVTEDLLEPLATQDGAGTVRHHGA